MHRPLYHTSYNNDSFENENMILLLNNKSFTWASCGNKLSDKNNVSIAYFVEILNIVI